MATASVEVLGPLAFVVVLELARLAREIPLIGYDGDTERMDAYDTDDDSRIVGGVIRMARGLRYSRNLVSVGGFHVVFTLTEVVLFGSIVIVYTTSAPFFDTAIAGEGTSGAIVVFLSLVWILLPIIVVDRYDDLAQRGISPLSIDVHIVTTFLYIAAIVMVVESQDLILWAITSIDVPGVDQFILVKVVIGGFIGVGGTEIRRKSALYRRYLRTELEQLREDPVVTGTSADGEGAGESTGSEVSDDAVED